MSARVAGAPAAFDRRLLPPLIAGAVLNPINSTIVSVALVPIGAALGAPPGETAWLISALYLATAVGQPVTGRLIDLFGPRRLFLPATALVGIAGVIGALAPNLGVLVVARVLLGFGTCAGYPAAMRLVRDESERTGRDSPAGVLTVLAISTQTVSVVGPLLGGLLIDVGGWRMTFAVNIPLAAVAFVLGWRRFPIDAPRRQGKAERSLGGVDLDVVGILLFAVTLVAFLLGLMRRDASSAWLLAIALLAGAAFVARERRHDDPFIDVRVLAGNVPLLLTYARAWLVYVVSYCLIYGFTQWLQEGRALSAGVAGLVTLPMFAVSIAVSGATGRRENVRAKLVVAAIGQLVVAASFLAMTPSTPLWALVGVVALFGVPQGLTGLALQNAVYRQADPDTIGASAGLLRTFGYLGAITSSVAIAGFFGGSADTAGLHHLAVFLLVISALLLGLTVADRSLRSGSSHERPTT